jgi:hypothetical protein
VLLSLSLCSALSPSISSQRLGGGGCGLVVVQRGVCVCVVGWVSCCEIVSGSVGDGGDDGSQR